MREEILNGNLVYPGSAIFDKYPDKADDIKSFWSAIWHNYLNDSDTNGVYWYDKLGYECYNDVIRRLSYHKWVQSHSIKARNWACVEIVEDKLLEFVSPDELQEVKAKHKYKRYTLNCSESRAAKLVRQNGKTKITGLVRTGFRDAGNTQFGYDMNALDKYEKAVKLNLTKSMDRIRKDYPEMQATTSSYDNVSVGIYDWHRDNQLETFTTGHNINDSRGRAISNALRKVANPISSKDFRSALVITYDE